MENNQEERRYGLVIDPKVPVDQAARFLGVSLSTTWRLIRKGELGCYQIGGRTVVGMSQIEAFLSRMEKRNVKAVLQIDSTVSNGT